MIFKGKRQPKRVHEQEEEKDMSRHRFVYQDDLAMEKPFDYGVMLRLLKYVKPYRFTLLPPIVISTLIAAAAKLSIPFVVILAIDDAIEQFNVQRLFMYAGIMIGLYVAQWLANTFRIRLTNLMGQRIIYDIRYDLFRHIQTLSFRFFDQRPAGSVLVRVTNDVNALQDLFTSGVVNMLIDMVQLTGIIIILLSLNWNLGLAVIVVVPLMFFISTHLRRHIRRAWQTVRMKQSRLNAHLNESIRDQGDAGVYAGKSEYAVFR